MGSTQSSTIDVQKDILNKTMNSLETQGNITKVSQTVDLNNTTINVDGRDCPSGAIVSIGNYNNITADTIMTAVADAYADVVMDLSSQLENNIPASWVPGANTDSKITDKVTLKNMMENHLKSTCNDTSINQRTTVSDVVINNMCGNVDISNKNVAALSCASDAMAQAVQEIEADISTEAKNSSSNNNIMLIIAVVGVIIVAIFMFINPVVGIVILVLLIAGGLIYYLITNKSD